MKNVLFIFLLVVSGCGYTTRGFIYKEKGINIKPVVNEISIDRNDSTSYSYNTYPILLEKNFTNELIDRFHTEGGLKISNQDEGFLRLECVLRNYVKEALRYESDEDIEEERLRLYVHIILYDGQGEIIQDKNIVGETTYYLSGSLSKSESSAQVDLIDDTTRRILEAVIERW